MCDCEKEEKEQCNEPIYTKLKNLGTLEWNDAILPCVFPKGHVGAHYSPGMSTKEDRAGSRLK